ncbi:MAG: hypothetical protein ACI4PH_10285 [Faecousia sp.]
MIENMVGYSYIPVLMKAILLYAEGKGRVKLMASERIVLCGEKFTLDYPIMAGITIRMNSKTDSMKVMGDLSKRSERYGV